jgi:hypothetical protein
MTGFVRHEAVLFYVDHISVPVDHLGSFNGFGTGPVMILLPRNPSAWHHDNYVISIVGQIYLTRIRDTNLGSDLFAWSKIIPYKNGLQASACRAGPDNGT